MSYHQRFIPGEEIGQAVHWDFGAVDMDALRLDAQRREEELARQAEREEAVRQEAYAQGLKDGYEQAMPEVQRRVDVFTSTQGQEAARELAEVIRTARAQLDAAERAIAPGVLDLVCAVAREVLRREIDTHADVLLPVIREGLQALFNQGRQIVIKLHPRDLERVQIPLRAEYPDLALLFLADEELTPGGCLIESDGTLIDATVQARWAHAVGRLGRDVPWEGGRDDSA